MKKHKTGENAEDFDVFLEGVMSQLKEHVKNEYKAERHRSPLVKTLGWLWILSMIFSFGVAIYGFFNIPYAPIREVNGRYYAKYDRPSTREEFERYNHWMSMVFIAFGTTVPLGFLFITLDTRGRKKNNIPVEKNVFG